MSHETTKFPLSSSSNEITIRSVVKSDEREIKSLFYNDVYHWTRWVKPIFKHGVVGLFHKPIIVWMVASFVVGLFYDWILALQLVVTLALLLCAFLVAKVLRYCAYFWYIPEFVNDNLAEVYSKDGFAFLVASVRGKIVGCVGVAKIDKKVC